MAITTTAIPSIAITGRAAFAAARGASSGVSTSLV
jgi:hypothetical protein